MEQEQSFSFDEQCSEICNDFTARVTKKVPPSRRSAALTASGPVAAIVGFVLLAFGLR